MVTITESLNAISEISPMTNHPFGPRGDGPVFREKCESDHVLDPAFHHAAAARQGFADPVAQKPLWFNCGVHDRACDMPSLRGMSAVRVEGDDPARSGITAQTTTAADDARPSPCAPASPRANRPDVQPRKEAHPRVVRRTAVSLSRLEWTANRHAPAVRAHARNRFSQTTTSDLSSVKTHLVTSSGLTGR